MVTGSEPFDGGSTGGRRPGGRSAPAVSTSRRQPEDEHLMEGLGDRRPSMAASAADAGAGPHGRTRRGRPPAVARRRPALADRLPGDAPRAPDHAGASGRGRAGTGGTGPGGAPGPRAAETCSPCRHGTTPRSRSTWSPPSSASRARRGRDSGWPSPTGPGPPPCWLSNAGCPTPRGSRRRRSPLPIRAVKDRSETRGPPDGGCRRRPGGRPASGRGTSSSSAAPRPRSRPSSPHSWSSRATATSTSPSWAVAPMPPAPITSRVRGSSARARPWCATSAGPTHSTATSATARTSPARW